MMEASPEEEVVDNPTKPKKKSFFRRIRPSFRKSRKNQEEEEVATPPTTPEKEDLDYSGYSDVSSGTPPLTPDHAHNYPTEDQSPQEPGLNYNPQEKEEGRVDGGDPLEGRIIDESKLLNYESPDQPKTRDGVPVITSHDADRFRPSEVNDYGYNVSGIDPATADVMRNKSTRRKKETMILKEAPSAKESAYAGPPRYDWIDIETAAAVKVQAAYRRNKVMWELEKKGLSTAAMRNRKRAQKARKWKKSHVSEDTPGILRFCGIGFLFGDATEEDMEVTEQMARDDYEKKKREKDEEEQRKRRYRARKKKEEQLVEEVEVVDDYELSGQ